MNAVKEIKNYYVDDKLNKGYPKSEQSNNDVSGVSNLHSHLPPVDVISAYEEIYPGTLEKVLKLVAVEQERRIEMEKIIHAANEKSRRLGALFGILSIAVICTTTGQIANKNLNSGILFAFIAFGAVFGVSVLAYFKSQNRYQAKWKGDSNPSQTFNNKRKFFRRDRKKR